MLYFPGCLVYGRDKLCMFYSSEDFIDSGAITLEFLEECIQEMGKLIFPDGSPLDWSSHVQNGDFILFD
jgi:hypothetical protein